MGRILLREEVRTVVLGHEGEKLMQKLEEKGIECGPHSSDAVKIVLTTKEFEDNIPLIQEVVAVSEWKSRK